MTWETALGLSVAMLLGNAFFVGAEFGLVSSRRSSIELRALGGSRAAKITLDAMAHVSLMLAGAQLGVTLCSLVLGAVAEPLLSHWLEAPFHALGMPAYLLHPVAFVLALALVVYLHVVIGEMVPKNLALASPERTALLLTPPLVLFVRLTKPVVVGLNLMANGCLRLLGIAPQREVPSTFTRDEVAGFVKESHREGLLSEDEEQLLSGALRFDERTVKAVMLPLDRIVSVSASVTPAALEELAAQTGYSRFPVRNASGEFAGYLHLKDILDVDEAHHRESIPAKDLRPMGRVKATASLRSALVSMQRSGVHLAQVIGLDGAVVGVVMLEDVLEEIVGEIRDNSQKRKSA